MKYVSGLSVAAIFFILCACDQLPQKGSPGEIIVIGNGILNLNESDGVIADALAPDGKSLVSLIISPTKTEELVRDRATNKAIPTYYNWATSGEKNDPVLSLDIKEIEKKCRYFESLQNGDLVCRRDLESLDISPVSPPQFTSTGDVFFLDSKNQLMRLFAGKLTTLSTQVYRFVVDKDANLLFWRAGEDQKLSYHLWRNGNEVVFASDVYPGEIEFVVGRDGVIYPLYIKGDPSHAPGLYKWVWPKDNLYPAENLVQAWPMDWIYQSRTNDPDAKMLMVSVLKTDETRALVEVSEQGLRLLDDKAMESKPTAETSTQTSAESDSEVQKLGSAFVSKNRKDETYSYCLSSSQQSDLPIHCESIFVEGRKILDVILKGERDVYVLSQGESLRKIDHYQWDEAAQKLLSIATRDLEDPIVRFRTPTEKLSAAVPPGSSELVPGQ